MCDRLNYHSFYFWIFSCLNVPNVRQIIRKNTLELTALKRPFIFFPIEGHSEQESVAEHLARDNAGIKMYYYKTTPDSLAEQVISNLDKEVSYKPINMAGAQKAAQIINWLI